MTNKLLPAIALASLLPLAGATLARAEDPPAVESGGTEQPDDPDAEPYPPDGVTDPNVTYPTDASAGAEQGETGVAAPAAPDAPAAAPAAKGQAN